jgi:hypothetical protein
MRTEALRIEFHYAALGTGTRNPLATPSPWDPLPIEVSVFFKQLPVLDEYRSAGSRRQ